MTTNEEETRRRDPSGNPFKGWQERHQQKEKEKQMAKSTHMMMMLHSDALGKHGLLEPMERARHKDRDVSRTLPGAVWEGYTFSRERRGRPQTDERPRVDARDVDDCFRHIILLGGPANGHKIDLLRSGHYCGGIMVPVAAGAGFTQFQYKSSGHKDDRCYSRPGCQLSGKGGGAMSEHVAWLRYVEQHNGLTRIVLCDSDSPGAFKVYREPPAHTLQAQELLDWAADADKHGNRFVPVSTSTLRKLAAMLYAAPGASGEG